MNPIPGVTIHWAPNPLRTVVEIDERARLLLWHRLKIDNLEELIVSAKVALDPEHHEWLASIGKDVAKTSEEMIAYAVRELKADYALGDDEWFGKKLDARLDEQTAEYVEELAKEHDGDCVCVACSCLKCRAEGLVGVDTLAGLGKHEANDIRCAFFLPGGGQRTIAEAVEYLRDYRPTYKPNPRWPEEDWNKHVPRWLEEGRRAFEWLDKYRAEHFAA